MRGVILILLTQHMGQMGELAVNPGWVSDPCLGFCGYIAASALTLSLISLCELQSELSPSQTGCPHASFYIDMFYLVLAVG